MMNVFISWRYCFVIFFSIWITFKASTKVESSIFRKISGKSAQDKNTKKVYCLLTQRVSIMIYIHVFVSNL